MPCVDLQSSTAMVWITAVFFFPPPNSWPFLMIFRGLVNQACMLGVVEDSKLHCCYTWEDIFKAWNMHVDDLSSYIGMHKPSPPPSRLFTRLISDHSDFLLFRQKCTGCSYVKGIVWNFFDERSYLKVRKSVICQWRRF